MGNVDLGENMGLTSADKHYEELPQGVYFILLSIVSTTYIEIYKML